MPFGTGRLGLFVRRILRRMWFRAALYAVAALVTVTVAAWIGPVLPRSWAARVTEGSVNSLLEIMASSMLVVATFSLGTMVSAFTAAASVATPRASNILIDDPISQNVLATFVGAFVFSIIGLIAMSLGLFGGDGRIVLLVVTVSVIIAVIFTLFGWLDYLANMVRLGEILRKIEAHALNVMTKRAETPFLGGRMFRGQPSGGTPFKTNVTGYVTSIDIEALQDMAYKASGVVHAAVGPGDHVDPDTVAGYTTWAPNAEDQAVLRAAFVIEPERSFEQDPRYCLIVLSEVASRALSPGINDPGTAIGIIGRLQRVLTVWTSAGDGVQPAYGLVHMPALSTDDLFEDAFGPLARDAAPALEVGLRLQKALGALARIGGPTFAEAAALQSARALDHARSKLVLEADVERLKALALDVQSARARS